MAFYFAPIAEGLGDLLLTLPALDALIATDEKTYLVVRSRKQLGCADVINGLAGCIHEPDFLKRPLADGDNYINLRTHPLFMHNVVGSDRFIEEFGCLSIIDIYELIAYDYLTVNLGIHCTFRHYKPFSANPQPLADGKILLIPGSAGTYKCLETARWMHLMDLLRTNNLEFLVLGKPEDSQEVRDLLTLGAPHLPTPDLRAAIDAISAASAVVSVDTGLMHLAVQQGIPTITMHQSRSIFVRPEPNCYPILAKPCIEACLSWTKAEPSAVDFFDNFEGPENYACPAAYEDRCMNSISPATILEKLLEVVP